jgi:hypothetical protein
MSSFYAVPRERATGGLGTSSIWNNAVVVWLGDKRGYLSDWLTQQWVRATGRRVNLVEEAWLVGKDIFADYATDNLLEAEHDGTRGLIQDFRELCVDDPCVVATAVREFYERTSKYELDAWSEWGRPFRLFGRALGKPSKNFALRMRRE